MTAIDRPASSLERLEAHLEDAAAVRWPGRDDPHAASDPDWRHGVDDLVGPPVPADQRSPWPPADQTPGSLLARAIRRAFKAAIDRRQAKADPLPGPDDREAVLRRLVKLRRQFDGWAERRSEPGGATVTSGTIGGVPCDTVTTEDADTSKVVLYVHGGAYVVCSPRSHWGLAAAASRAAGARAVVPDYGMAPERPFPSGLEDVLAAYRGLLDLGTAPTDVVVMGDSAGGGLGLALLLACKASGTPMPAAYVGLSPWTDLTSSGASTTERVDADPWLGGEGTDLVVDAYRGDVAADHPLVSPLFADLSGLPPMLVQVGTHEVIMDDSTRLVQRARAAGVDATLAVHEGMWHVFQAFGRLPQTRRAWTEVRRFLQRVRT